MMTQVSPASGSDMSGKRTGALNAQSVRSPAGGSIIQKGREITMKKYVCEVCGWVYDEEVGDAELGIAHGTPFSELPEDFECPMCGVGKDQFAEE